MPAIPLKPSLSEVAAFVNDANDGKTEAVREFLDKYGTEIDREDQGMTALRAAAWEGHEDTVALLLERGADVDRGNESGFTALMYSAWFGLSKNVVEMLLQKGAAIDKKGGKYGATTLMEAAMFGRTDIVELLLERGASIDEKNDEGKTALMLAQENNHAESVVLLERAVEKQRQREHEQWLEDTDFSRGLQRAIPVRKLPKFSSC